MKERTLTKGEQKRVDACENVVKWASENKKDRGCIVLATDMFTNKDKVLK